MNKARLIAISGMCGAVAASCMLLVGLIPAMKWAMLFLGVLASVAVAIPVMIDYKNIVYTLLVYVASSVLGVFLGLANVAFVMPIVAFSMPFAIVKVCGETLKLTVEKGEETVLEDPFDGGDDKKLVEMKINGTPRMPKVVKWVLYYVLLEAGLGLSVLAAYLFTKPVFEAFVESPMFWWVLAGLQLIVFPYDMLMTGCLSVTAKALRKVIKP